MKKILFLQFVYLSLRNDGFPLTNKRKPGLSGIGFAERQGWPGWEKNA
jgi:hypothetical protein